MCVNLVLYHCMKNCALFMVFINSPSYFNAKLVCIHCIGIIMINLMVGDWEGKGGNADNVHLSGCLRKAVDLNIRTRHSSSACAHIVCFLRFCLFCSDPGS